MKSGVINVYKEAGYTSFDVVAKLRGILGIKKIGHTGTLDPDATGVLPVCIGKATKVCDLLTDKRKTYHAVMKLGVVTDTQDISGQVLQEKEVCVSPEDIIQTGNTFLGVSKQIPPMYSALKVNGKKLCDLARQGIEVERKPRDITIYDLTITEISLPYVTFDVTCSKGTYVRTICQDFGEKLDCGACLQSLVRTQVSIFSLPDSLKLAEIEDLKQKGEIERVIISVDQLFSQLPKAIVAQTSEKKAINGAPLIEEDFTEKVTDNESVQLRVYMQDNTFVGIYEKKGHLFKLQKMFLE